MAEKKSNRIIFLDLMRAFAVLMMVQGHTVHTFLDESIRTSESVFYVIWLTMRGFTAPIFMFTAGVVFTYLLFFNSQTHNKQRVVKGLKRFLLLVLLGYMLRYPTYKVFDFSDVTAEQWRTFFAVDALHLIGFGLLFIIMLSLIAEKIKVSPYLTLSIGAMFFVIAYPFVVQIEWIEILPAPVAAYMYSKTGSLFPLFPWAGYVLGGSILGVFLAHNPLIFKKKRFGSSLIALGLSFMLVYFLSAQINFLIEGTYLSISYGVSIFFLRIGFVIMLNGLVAILVIKLDNIPDFIKLIGRHTLLIYVVHLIILYGSAWVPGLYGEYGQTLSTPLTLLTVLVMYLLMGGMVIGLDKFQKYRKKKYAA